MKHLKPQKPLQIHPSPIPQVTQKSDNSQNQENKPVATATLSDKIAQFDEYANTFDRKIKPIETALNALEDSKSDHSANYHDPDKVKAHFQNRKESMLTVEKQLELLDSVRDEIGERTEEVRKLIGENQNNAEAYNQLSEVLGRLNSNLEKMNKMQEVFELAGDDWKQSNPEATETEAIPEVHPDYQEFLRKAGGALQHYSIIFDEFRNSHTKDKEKHNIDFKLAQTIGKELGKNPKNDSIIDGFNDNNQYIQKEVYETVPPNAESLRERALNNARPDEQKIINGTDNIVEWMEVLVEVALTMRKTRTE